MLKSQRNRMPISVKRFKGGNLFGSDNKKVTALNGSIGKGNPF